MEVRPSSTDNPLPVPDDENLPEVVPDSTPQVISGRDAFLAHDQFVERDPKYIADTSPNPEDKDYKFAIGEDGSPTMVKSPDGTWRPAAVSPVDPQSAVEEGRGADVPPAGEEEEPVKEDTICGLKKKTFWIVLVVVLVVIAAALGGGLGGGLSARNLSSSGDAEGSEQGEGDSPTSTTESTTETSPTPTPTPDLEFLNNQTVPDRGIAFQGFSEHEYLGEASEIIKDEGFFDLGFNATSYVWIPNTSDCCVTFCQSHSNTSEFWCQERFRNASSGSFPRVGILCGITMDRGAETHRCAPEEEEEEGDEEQGAGEEEE